MRMNAWDWYLDAWRDYANFEGRSLRPAYWYFCLVHLIVFCLLLIGDVLLLLSFPDAQASRIRGLHPGQGFPILTIIYVAASFLPAWSLTVRRLHDREYSGRVLLFGVVPVLGVVGLLYVLTFVLAGD